MADEVKTQWMLDGIKAERDRIAARLQFLDQTEANLRGAAMTGSTSNGRKSNAKASAKNATVKGRKRVVSEETREKMRKAQQARHARLAAAQGAAQTTPTQAPVATTTEPPPVA